MDEKEKSNMVKCEIEKVIVGLSKVTNASDNIKGSNEKEFHNRSKDKRERMEEEEKSAVVKLEVDEAVVASQRWQRLAVALRTIAKRNSKA
ncbi:hypothetical protein COCNU_05G003740 [Cocos nucifera]|uniref:Uncharacterized protein n=1 Tax=Cocos nucifera TaxID=13894 RepID=A0A8K0N1C5_COCNU|nr:hypothetical protein COCNU_05G003740 [Cocos nucifera]